MCNCISSPLLSSNELLITMSLRISQPPNSILTDKKYGLKQYCMTINALKMSCHVSVRILNSFIYTSAEMPLPPELILTRLGTWLEAMLYYKKYLENVKSFCCWIFN